MFPFHGNRDEEPEYLCPSENMASEKLDFSIMASIFITQTGMEFCDGFVRKGGQPISL
jgi:hypothetical protein